MITEYKVDAPRWWAIILLWWQPQVSERAGVRESERAGVRESERAGERASGRADDRTSEWVTGRACVLVGERATRPRWGRAAGKQGSIATGDEADVRESKRAGESHWRVSRTGGRVALAGGGVGGGKVEGGPVQERVNRADSEQGAENGGRAGGNEDADTRHGGNTDASSVRRRGKPSSRWRSCAEALPPAGNIQ